jgi:hypothetical protein
VGKVSEPKGDIRLSYVRTGDVPKVGDRVAYYKAPGFRGEGIPAMGTVVEVDAENFWVHVVWEKYVVWPRVKGVVTKHGCSALNPLNEEETEWWNRGDSTVQPRGTRGDTR